MQKKLLFALICSLSVLMTFGQKYLESGNKRELFVDHYMIDADLYLLCFK